MYDENVKKYVEPLIDNIWNKKDRNIIDRLIITFKDFLYFKCLEKIFPNYAEYIFMCLITTLKYKKYNPHDILINYNDTINRIFFIIKGKLNVYKISISKIKLILSSLCKKHKNPDKGRQIIEYFNAYVKRYIKTISEKNIFLTNKKNQPRISLGNIYKKNSQILELDCFYKVIINQNKIYDYSLEEGKIFGEEYIYNDIRYSNCILECDSDCIVGELDKDDYETIYKKINIMERSSITGFLVNLKVFNSSNFFLPKLQRCLIKRNFAKNEIIFKQNDNFRTFFIIRQGKVNLSLKIPKKVNCELIPEIIMGNQKNKRFTSSNAFVVKGEYLENNEYNLLTVQNGEFIGEIEYYKKKDKYMYTAQCLEDNCILFEIDLFLFEHLIKNNESINSNLKGFYEKIKEKMKILQERIYIMKKSENVIEKSDYVYSKHKFTRNLLQNNPLKEEKENKNYLGNNINKKYNKSNKNNYSYMSELSPFFKRNISAQRNIKFNKIQINKDFFQSRNISKEKIDYFSKSASQSMNKLKERNIATSPNISKNNISKSKLMIYTSNIYSKFNTSKENIVSNNNNIKENKNRMFLKNEIFNKNFISNLNTYEKPIKKNDIFNNFKKRHLSKKFKNLCLSNNYNNFDNSNLDTSFDFLNPNLDCTKNDRIKNIPIILKETKNSKRYKLLYDKDRIKKINSFYFESPHNNRINKIFPYKEEIKI